MSGATAVVVVVDGRIVVGGGGRKKRAYPLLLHLHIIDYWPPPLWGDLFMFGGTGGLATLGVVVE